MEERLNITLCDIGGLQLHITPRRSNTLREVINEARLFPSNAAQPLCLFRGNQVHVDVPLAYLNVNDGETITVMFPKLSVTEIIREKAKHIQKLENDLYREALRVMDVQFSSIETCEKANLIYEEMFKDKIDEEEINKDALPCLTKFPKPRKSLSVDPLPNFWN